MGGKQEGMSEMSAHNVSVKTPAHEGIDASDIRDLNAAEAKEVLFENALRRAIEANRISDARTLVANAEAVLAAHGAPEVPASDRMTQAKLAAAKARIAIATGDGAAARAILVRAIENNPKAPTLRVLMTEVMMAAGRASDVRPVLQHLGHDTVLEQGPSDDALPTPPSMRDHSV